MSRPRPFRWFTAAIVAIAMLHAVADAAQACEHGRQADIAVAQSADPHAGHHGSSQQDHDVPCDDALQCCLANTSGVIVQVATVVVTHHPPSRVTDHVAGEPRSLILPPDPPPPRA